LDLIVSEKSGIVVQCLYYGYKRENMVSRTKTLHYGDTFSVSNQGKYVFGIGWYVLIIINGESKECVRIIQQEEAINYNKDKFIIDLML
jgi:hypothetical protein